MKFLCIKCDHFMDYESKEQVGTLRLGITFACKACGNKVAMVTNPGETQLVSGLGVQIGGRTVPAEPMEFTRGAIKAEGQPAGETAMNLDMGNCPFPGMLAGTPFKESGGSSKPAEPAGENTPNVDMGNCPFPGMLAGTPFKTTESAPKSAVFWTQNAEKRLENVPSFVRTLARAGIEQYAQQNGYPEIDDKVMDEYREKVGM